MINSDLFRQPDINQGVQDCLSIPGAVLLDVRSPREFRGGHIPGSCNLPLQYIDEAEEQFFSKETPLYVYCHSGMRSQQAASDLKQMGFVNVHNIGGIITYEGPVEQ